MPHQITSEQHPWIKHLVKLRHNRDYRYEHQSVVIEGIKPISELCVSTKFKSIVALNESLLPKNVKADEIFLVNATIMKKLSVMETPEGVIAELAMPKPSALKGSKRILALDGVSDPGNLGTLLRTALALGWDGAFIVEDSCDPFNEKALRAARGATFRLPLAWGGWEDLNKLIKENSLNPLIADLKGLQVKDVPKKNGILLVLGNEAHGASEEAKKACQPVTIPMSKEMESLNVSIAGGILMYMLHTS